MSQTMDGSATVSTEIRRFELNPARSTRDIARLAILAAGRYESVRSARSRIDLLAEALQGAPHVHHPTWIILGIIVVLVMWVIMIYNGLVAHAAAGQPVLRRHRRAAEAAPRPDPEPGRDREGLRGARARHARSGRPGAQRRGGGARGRAGRSRPKTCSPARCGQLFALSEAYPDLKANANFQQLQAELSDIENKLAAARRFFNNAVQRIQHRHPAIPGGAVRRRRSASTPQQFFDLGDDAQGARAGAAGEVLTAARQPTQRWQRVSTCRPAAWNSSLRALHPYPVEQAPLDRAADRAVLARLRAGLCRRAGRRGDRLRCLARWLLRRRGAISSRPRPSRPSAPSLWIVIAY